jgi:hypothetical protein
MPALSCAKHPVGPSTRSKGNIARSHRLNWGARFAESTDLLVKKIEGGVIDAQRTKAYNDKQKRKAEHIEVRI